jgi:hypothetical protein
VEVDENVFTLYELIHGPKYIRQKAPSIGIPVGTWLKKGWWEQGGAEDHYRPAFHRHTIAVQHPVALNVIKIDGATPRGRKNLNVLL